MRYFHQVLISLGLLFSSFAYAVDFYAEALYWQISENIDWALTNNLSLPNQTIAYKTINFNFAPGFRVGAGIQKEDWNTRLLYTQYHVQQNAITQGNVISAFMPSKFIETFYHSVQVNFAINLNMFDLDLYKTIPVGDSLFINPLIGLKGGSINQRLNLNYQGNLVAWEKVTNNFTGFGPKIGIESRWDFYKSNDYRASLFADLVSSFMWGKWVVNDHLIQSNSPQISYVDVGTRDLGALAVQGILGLNVDYKNLSIKVGYEASDWFNQYQVFDNATGSHSNDLVLQGTTFVLSYRW